MSEFIERARDLDRQFHMTRRELIASLGAVAFSPVLKLAAQAPTPPIPVSTISHVALTVADFKRTVDFYQRLFGLTVITYQGPPTYLTPGEAQTAAVTDAGIPGLVLNSSLAVDEGPAPPSINHFCLGAECLIRTPPALNERNNSVGHVRKTPELRTTIPTASCFRCRTSAIAAIRPSR